MAATKKFYFVKSCWKKGGNTMPKTVPKNTAGTKKTTAKKSGKKLNITLDKELFEQLENYLEEYGFSKEEFVKKAIREKISRDKISGMIDTMIR
jgi:hypothetical protein